MSATSVKIITPIDIQLAIDGRADDGAYSLVEKTDFSVGTTTVSTYQSRKVNGYRRQECTAYYNNISYSSESIYYWFGSVGDKIVIPVQGFFN